MDNLGFYKTTQQIKVKIVLMEKLLNPHIFKVL